MADPAFIQDVPTRDQYTAAAAQTIFDYTFPIFDQVDLVIEKTRISDGVTIILVLTTDYAVTGVGAQAGGTIVLTSGASAGDIITITRQVELKRITDFSQEAAFNSSNVNLELNRIVQMVQDRDRDIDQTLRIPDADVNSPANDMPDETARADKMLSFDTQGQPITPISTGAVQNLLDANSPDLSLPDLAVVSTIAALSALLIANVSDADRIYLKNRALEGDGGGDIFRVDLSDLSTEVTNDPQKGYVVPFDEDVTGASGAFIRENGGAILAQRFGLNAVDSTVGLNAAKNYAVLGIDPHARELFIPDGIHNISSTLAWSVGQNSTMVRGSGMGKCILKWIGAANGTILQSIGSGANANEDGDNYFLTFKDLTIDGDNVADKGIFTSFTYHTLFDRIEIRDCLDRGLHGEQGFYNKVKDCVLLRNGDGVFIGDTANAWMIEGGRYKDNGRGIVFDADGGVRPHGCTIQSATIEGNTISGVSMLDCFEMRLIGSYLESNGVHQVLVDGAVTGADRCVIKANNFTGAVSDKTIKIDRAEFTTVDGGNFINFGLELTANAERTNIVDNAAIQGGFTDDSSDSWVRDTSLSLFYRKIGFDKKMNWTIGGSSTILDVGNNLFDLKSGGSTVFRASLLGVRAVTGAFIMKDGVGTPLTVAGQAQMYVDTVDGDFKIKFGDGTIKTIVTDT